MCYICECKFNVRSYLLTENAVSDIRRRGMLTICYNGTDTDIFKTVLHPIMIYSLLLN